VALQAALLAPPREGTYYLQWDLVQENVIWFSSKSGAGSDPIRQEVGPALAGSTSGSAGAARIPPGQIDMPPPVDLEAMANFDSVDRAKLWRAALAMFLAHPLTGVGPDGFRNLYGPYTGVANWNKNIYTNNTYVEMFANLGLLGGLAFLWLAGLALWLALRRLLRGPLDARWAIHLGATAGLVAFFFHGFADYFLFSTPMYTVFWFLLAVGVRDQGSGVSVFQQTLTPDP
jgi:O-antigen ligase